MQAFRSAILLAFAAATFVSADNSQPVTFPLIPEDAIPVTELRVSDTSYAAIRKPTGPGPFPAVIFLHGGLGRGSMESLRRNAVRQPTQARFLAWGYVAINATRRDIQHDPQDRAIVQDVLDLVKAVRELKYVDPESIALYGGSGGGTLALEVASVTGKVAAVVAGEPATIIYMGMFTKEHVTRQGDRRQEVMNADPHKLYTPRLRQLTRKKLAGLNTPVLLLHGDQHMLKRFNLEIFVPEAKALGKPVAVSMYPGEPHGFYWGQGRSPVQALKANQDAEAFLRRHVKTQPKPLPSALSKPVEVQPMGRPDNN